MGRKHTYSRKENGSIGSVTPDTAYILVLDIMYFRYGVRPDLLKKVTRNMAVDTTQPFDCQAVSLVVSRQSRHSASLEGQRDKRAIL